MPQLFPTFWRHWDWFWLVMGLSAGLLAGCARPFTPVSNPIEIDRAEYRRVFEATVQSLRALGFRVDRQDYRFGRLTTQPQTSPTIVEFWTSVNTTGDQALQSTFHHLRRRTTVFLDPSTNGSVNPPGSPAATPEAIPLQGSYQLRVEVVLEKRQAPRHHLTGSTHGHEIIAHLHALPTEWAQPDLGQIDEWQPIGRDSYLEQRLLNDIIRRSLAISAP